MIAQINNDAAGWEDPIYAELYSESEPVDPAQIKGNYTREEHTAHGYKVVMPIAMANDYWGYIVTYREYQAKDHYRKALTGLGPHSSDFFATRLSRMAAELNGGTPVTLAPKDIALAWESTHQIARQAALGAAATAFLPAYEATHPSDGGTPRILAEPADIQRFSAAHVRWVGGANYFDVPVVRDRAPRGRELGAVRGAARRDPDARELSAARGGARLRGGDVRVDLGGHLRGLRLGDRDPRHPGPRAPARDRSGRKLADPERQLSLRDRRRAARRVQSAGAAAAGEHALPPDERPVHRRRRGRGSPSRRSRSRDRATSRSRSGRCTPSTGRSSVPVDYPDSYATPFTARFIAEGVPYSESQRNLANYAGGHQEQFCYHCSFRPWIDTGEVASAAVTVTRAGGGSETVPAALQPNGRWLGRGEPRPRRHRARRARRSRRHLRRDERPGERAGAARAGRARAVGGFRRVGRALADPAPGARRNAIRRALDRERALRAGRARGHDRRVSRRRVAGRLRRARVTDREQHLVLRPELRRAERHARRAALRARAAVARRWTTRATTSSTCSSPRRSAAPSSPRPS